MLNNVWLVDIVEISTNYLKDHLLFTYTFITNNRVTSLICTQREVNWLFQNIFDNPI